MRHSSEVEGRGLVTREAGGEGAGGEGRGQKGGKTGGGEERKER